MKSEELIIILVLFPFLQAVLALLLPQRLLRWAGVLFAGFALLHFCNVLYLSSRLFTVAPVKILIPWLPEFYINISFLADGLALFFALLITGMGALVLFYASFYFENPSSQVRRFYCYINVFMGAMLGAVLSDNLIQLFMFWELTGITSYLLISYHMERPAAREAARMAVLITSLASLCLLIGFILIGILDQTLELSEITRRGIVDEQHPLWILSIMVLVLIGIGAKSAQFPQHFWLPEAMAAPTPVSAYLHSATMVKLGIYLTARLYPLFVDTALWFPLITSLSLVTVVLGAFCALNAKKLKQILAYATISQLGFFISFYGIGDPQGLEYDYVHIFNHALYKGSLFMLAGILAYSANITHIHQLRGLPRAMPFVTTIFLISIAAMAGVPGTTGFLSKELLVKDVLMLLEKEPEGAIILGGLMLGLLLKIAFSYRLVHFLFFAAPQEEFKVLKYPPKLMLLPPLILSALALVLGIWPKGLEILTEAYFLPGLHDPTPDKLELWHGFSLNLFVSLGLFVGGVALFHVWHRVPPKKQSTDDEFSLMQAGNAFIVKLPSLAKSLTSLVHRNTAQSHITYALLAFSSVVGLHIFLGPRDSLQILPIDQKSICQILLVLSVTILIILRNPMAKLITLGVIGFLVTYYFVLTQAPDVAITQMVVEVASLFIMILVFLNLAPDWKSKIRAKRLIIGALLGISAAQIPLLKHLNPEADALASFYLENTEILAKGANAVNTILVDFRGLDTLFEICVVAVAALGVSAICFRGRTVQLTHAPSFIPTPLLKHLMPLVFSITVPFSLHLLIRGHDHSGGGFAGGMLIAIAFILLGMSVNRSRIFVLDRLNPLYLMVTGLTIAISSTLISLVSEGKFMLAYFHESSTLVSTPFLFDFGIYLMIIGAVLSMTYAIRWTSLEEEGKL